MLKGNQKQFKIKSNYGKAFVYCRPCVEWEEGISETDNILLCDAQTSGRRLVEGSQIVGIVLAENEAKKLEKELRQSGVREAVIVDRFIKGNTKELLIR